MRGGCWSQACRLCNSGALAGSRIPTRWISSSALKTHRTKYCCSFSLAKLMQSCSRPLCSKTSKPNMSSKPMKTSFEPTSPLPVAASAMSARLECCLLSLPGGDPPTPTGEPSLPGDASSVGDGGAPSSSPPCDSRPPCESPACAGAAVATRERERRSRVVSVLSVCEREWRERRERGRERGPGSPQQPTARARSQGSWVPAQCDR